MEADSPEINKMEVWDKEQSVHVRAGATSVRATTPHRLRVRYISGSTCQYSEILTGWKRLDEMQ
jgi:hypothetical protein